MDWKISLDRYLTNPPEDNYTEWCEEVTANQMTAEFYYQNEDWIMDNDSQCDKWLNKLFNKGKEPKQAAIIIEKAFNIYLTNHAR